MGLLDLLKGKARGRGTPGPYVLNLKCGRCGEIVAARLEPRIQAGAEYGSEGTTYRLRKIVVGNDCPNRMELEITYDSAYREIERQVSGGEVQPES